MRKYTKTISLHPCKMKKEDFLKLHDIIKPFDTSELMRFEISTSSNTCLITEEEFETFFNHAELPDTVKNLNINFTTWKNNELIESIRITFTSTKIQVSVEGEDQIRVYGKSDVIRSFLTSKKPWYWPIISSFSFLLGVTFGAVFSNYLTSVINGGGINVIINLTFLVLLAGVIYLHIKGYLLSHTQIVIRNSKSIMNKEAITIIISVLTLIVSIISGIVMKFID